MNKYAFSKFDLSDRSALITGGAGLLGVEHAKALLSAGADLVLADLNENNLSRVTETLKSQFKSSSIISIVMDVADPDSVESSAAYLSSEIGGIDILVNNAAIDPKVDKNGSIVEKSRLEELSIDQWNLEINVGLTGVFVCSKVFGTAMAKRGYGVILNIASDLSVISPDQRLYKVYGKEEHLQPVKPITYSAIKAGMVGMTRYLATYWADKGVRANALSPGGVFNGQAEEFVERLSTLIPVGRMANKDEYQSAIQFLCSDASSYLNGQNIVMDGGRSIW